MPKALGEIFAALPKLGDSKENLEAFGAVLYALGLDPLAGGAAETEGEEKAPAEIAELARQRWEAKKARNFALADELRGKISALGWTVLDAKDGFPSKRRDSGKTFKPRNGGAGPGTRNISPNRPAPIRCFGGQDKLSRIAPYRPQRFDMVCAILAVSRNKIAATDCSLCKFVKIPSQYPITGAYPVV